MEDGTIVLVGATTENPSFELIAPLLSRARVLVFKPLDAAAVEKLLARAEAIEGKPLPLDAEARASLARMADGDGRAALTLAEEVWRSARDGEVFDATALQNVVQRRAPIYDKAQDGHYNLISALHKSVRGSDVDAALYYLCRMLDAGEDPLYLARRVVRMAVEDIGLADPQALVVANAAKDAYDFLGSPEGELAIAEAVIYVATAPKSNAAYMRLRRRDAGSEGSRIAAAAEAHPQRADQADAERRLQLWLRIRPRRAGGFLRPGLFPGKSRTAAVLPPAGTRLRTGDQEAARLLGEASQRAGRKVRGSRGPRQPGGGRQNAGPRHRQRNQQRNQHRAFHHKGDGQEPSERGEYRPARRQHPRQDARQDLRTRLAARVRSESPQDLRQGSLQSSRGSRKGSRSDTRPASRPAHAGPPRRDRPGKSKAPFKKVPRSAAPPRAPAAAATNYAAPQVETVATGVQTMPVTSDKSGMRLDRFLEAKFPGLSFSHIQRVIRKGEVRVNGKRTQPKARLEAGQSVRIPPVRIEPQGARSPGGEADTKTRDFSSRSRSTKTPM